MSEGVRGAMMSRGRGPPAGSDAASERAIKLFSLLPKKKKKTIGQRFGILFLYLLK